MGRRNEPGYAERDQIERRMRVAELRKAGIKEQTAIAERLGWSKATICRDFKVIDEEWRQSTLVDTAVAMGEDLARIDSYLYYLMPKIRQGDIQAIRTAADLVKQRGAMFGYNAPTRITGADGGPVAVRHTHTHHNLSGFSSEEATALYELAARYDDGDGG